MLTINHQQLRVIIGLNSPRTNISVSYSSKAKEFPDSIRYQPDLGWDKVFTT